MSIDQISNEPLITKSKKNMTNKELSHINEKNQPTMVDVGDKNITQREAQAQGKVFLPDELWQLIDNQEINTKKGPIFQTAIIAGTMAVKRTAELIPFCHPLLLDGCKIEIYTADNQEVVIDCRVRVQGKTGVEMEALTGVSVAALTIYDMAKAISHDIIIKEIKVMAKSGGKSDFKRDE